MSRKSVLRALAIVLVFAWIATAVDVPKLTLKFKSLKSGPKAQQTSLFGINNENVVVGDYIDQNGIEYGVRWDGKSKKFTTRRSEGKHGEEL